MSFNGSGTFQINTAGQPVVTGTVISSTAFNALTADLATGLSTCVTKDGQTTPTANLPMGNYKLTGLGAGSAATDSATLGQVQSTTVKLIGSVSGSDTITGSLLPALTAYTTGQSFYFVVASNNTGAATINIDSIGAKSITKNGSTALSANDLTAGTVANIVYDGTRFQLTNAPGVTGQVGTNSTAIGYQAIVSSTGNWNTAFGYQAGKNLTTASANTFVGYTAGTGPTSQGTNTAIGDSAFASGNYSGSTCLGQNAQVTGSSQVQLGGSGTTTYAYGSVQDRSDARDKTDIQDTDLGLNFVMALRPRKYKWDMRDDYRPKVPDPATATPEEWAAYQEASNLSNITHDGTHTRNRYHQGLIAQEVKATMDAMGVDFGGYQDHSINGGQDVKSIGYNEMIAPLIKAIQELKAEFDAYKASHP